MQVFIHNPDIRRSGGSASRGRAEQLSTQGDVSLLNINEVIGCLTAGRLTTDSKSDTLVVGTQTNLLGYDVANNQDIFYKEVRHAILVVVMSLSGSAYSACQAHSLKFNYEVEEGGDPTVPDPDVPVLTGSLQWWLV